MYKFRRIVFFLILLLSGTLYANQNGIENCDYIFNSLKADNYSPVKQDLISSGNNIFPYNIYFRLESKEKTQNPNNFLLVINQKDAAENLDFIKQNLKQLENENYNSNIIILLSYADDFIFNKENTIIGSKVFLDSIENKDTYTTLILNLNSDRNYVSSGTNGFTSPSNMVRTVYNNCLKSKLKFTLPLYYLSQTYSYKIKFDNTLDLYLRENIPAIKINLIKDSQHQEEISNLLVNICNDLIQLSSVQFDQHFLIYRFAHNYFRITEKTIVIIIIIIILSLLLFLFLFTFINNRIQKENWNNTRQMWYLVPITFVLLLASLFAGKYFSLFIFRNYSGIHRMMMTATFQFIFAVIFSGIFNTAELIYNKKYNNNTLDYLIIFCTFINQFIFLFVDVAFFPIFMFICFLAILSLVVQNKYIKIVFTPLMLLPYIFYGFQLLSIATEYKTEFNYNAYSFLFISLAFYPIFIMVFRHINGFIKNKDSKKNIIIANSIVSGLFCFGCLIFSSVFYFSVKQRFLKNEPLILVDTDDSLLNITYSDKIVFDNTIRTLNIHVPSATINCQLIINCDSAPPVLYSDNSYLNLSEKTVTFLIPEFPPENMTFNYGIPQKKSTIKLVVYTQTNENEFNRIEKSFIIN